jgi:pimeloyl-ACP methyl ester carboxylesterase
MERVMHIPAGAATLEGELTLPAGATGIVVFAASGLATGDASRNRHVMRALQRSGLGTLILDLAGTADEAAELRTRRYRFDVPLLAERLVHVTRTIREDNALRGLRVGYFASGAGSAVALAAAAGLSDRVSAVVTRGGRPDFAGAHLARITAATLFIVGGADRALIGISEDAYEQLHCVKQLVVVPGATHRFEESGALDEVAVLATDWFQSHLEAAVRA